MYQAQHQPALCQGQLINLVAFAGAFDASVILILLPSAHTWNHPWSLALPWGTILLAGTQTQYMPIYFKVLGSTY